MNRTRICLFMLCVTLITGCKGLSIPFISDDSPVLSKNYAIEGLDDDEEAKTFLKTVMDSRLQDIAELADEEDLARKEAYAERMLRTELKKALHSKGYYDAVVGYENTTQAEQTPEGEDAKDKESQENANTADGTFLIRPGKKYTISSVTTQPAKFSEFTDDLGIETGEPLDSAAILKAQNTFLRKIGKDKCFFSLNARNRVILDRSDKTAEVTFVVEAGNEAEFGPLTYEGNETVRNSYLKKLFPWKEGECFRREKIESLRQALIGTGLFSRAEILLPETVPAEGIVPVKVILKERAQRSVKVGATYYTDEGLGLEFGWEHRNFFGAAEKLKASLELSLLEQTLDVELTKPYFMRRDQSLSVNAYISREDTDAYEEISIGTGARINRKLSKHLSASVGTEIKVTNIDEENGDKQTFALLSGPSSLTYDSRDNSLDPTKGWQIKGVIEPFVDLFGESQPFVKIQALASHYLQVTDKLIWANRINLGSIAGAENDDIPASERFYAGGGGSIRGFGYQEVGPQENDDPTGGRSLVELSTEFRYKFTDSMGAVAFVDAGQVTEDVSPKFNDLSVGVGVGFRYYTDFGPLRFDIATPLTDSDTVDSNYQIYLSIGQAF